jgi:hypothetical protein
MRRPLFLQAFAGQEADDPVGAEKFPRQALALRRQGESILINLAGRLTGRGASDKGPLSCEHALVA